MVVEIPVWFLFAFLALLFARLVAAVFQTIATRHLHAAIVALGARLGPPPLAPLERAAKPYRPTNIHMKDEY